MTPPAQQVAAELRQVAALFQLRAIAGHMDFPPAQVAHLTRGHDDDGR